MAISVLKDYKRIYRFPEDLVDSGLDASGKPVQFVLFEIANPARATKMGGDDTKPKEETVVKTNGRMNFSADLKSVQPANLINSLSVIDAAIALPMPNDHVVTTAAKYDTDFEPSTLHNAANLMMSNAGAMDKIAGLTAGLISSNMTNSEKKTAANVGLSQGIVANPRHEVMFSGITFRSFTFSYMFAPKSAAESGLLRTLINTLRYYALPEMALGKSVYLFPGVFKISFYLGENENIWVPRIATSVLSRINVNYSPNGSTWASLPMGEPVQINLSLEFTEIVMIDRLKVDNSGTGTPDYTTDGY